MCSSSGFPIGVTGGFGMPCQHQVLGSALWVLLVWLFTHRLCDCAFVCMCLSISLSLCSCVCVPVCLSICSSGIWHLASGLVALWLWLCMTVCVYFQCLLLDQAVCVSVCPCVPLSVCLCFVWCGWVCVCVVCVRGWVAGCVDVLGSIKQFYYKNAAANTFPGESQGFSSWGPPSSVTKYPQPPTLNGRVRRAQVQKTFS